MIFSKKKSEFRKPYFSDKDTVFFPIDTLCGCEVYIYLSTLRDDHYAEEVTHGHLCEFHKEKAKRQYIREQERRVYEH